MRDDSGCLGNRHNQLYKYADLSAIHGSVKMTKLHAICENIVELCELTSSSKKQTTELWLITPTDTEKDL